MTDQSQVREVVAYLRVSTRRQGESGLGLEAQRAYIEQAARQEGWQVIAEFIDTVSGSIAPAERAECIKAMNTAKELGALLVVAKLDRLSRDVEHIAAMMKRVPLRVATMPSADNFQLHLFAALAEQERTFISQRTKDALAALKARAANGDSDAQASIKRRDGALEKGRKVAPAAMIAASKEKADTHAQGVRRHIEDAQQSGIYTLSGCAAYLNARGIKTRRGGEFSAMTVKRLLDRLGMHLRV